MKNIHEFFEKIQAYDLINLAERGLKAVKLSPVAFLVDAVNDFDFFSDQITKLICSKIFVQKIYQDTVFVSIDCNIKYFNDNIKPKLSIFHYDMFSIFLKDSLVNSMIDKCHKMKSNLYYIFFESNNDFSKPHNCQDIITIASIKKNKCLYGFDDFSDLICFYIKILEDKINWPIFVICPNKIKTKNIESHQSNSNFSNFPIFSPLSFLFYLSFINKKIEEPKRMLNVDKIYSITNISDVQISHLYQKNDIDKATIRTFLGFDSQIRCLQVYDFFQNSNKKDNEVLDIILINDNINHLINVNIKYDLYYLEIGSLIDYSLLFSINYLESFKINYQENSMFFSFINYDDFIYAKKKFYQNKYNNNNCIIKNLKLIEKNDVPIIFPKDFLNTNLYSFIIFRNKSKNWINNSNFSSLIKQSYFIKKGIKSAFDDKEYVILSFTNQKIRESTFIQLKNSKYTPTIKSYYPINKEKTTKKQIHKEPKRNPVKTSSLDGVIHEITPINKNKSNNEKTPINLIEKHSFNKDLKISQNINNKNEKADNLEQKNIKKSFQNNDNDKYAANNSLNKSGNDTNIDANKKIQFQTNNNPTNTNNDHDKTNDNIQIQNLTNALDSIDDKNVTPNIKLSNSTIPNDDIDNENKICFPSKSVNNDSKTQKNDNILKCEKNKKDDTTQNNDINISFEDYLLNIGNYYLLFLNFVDNMDSNSDDYQEIIEHNKANRLHDNRDFLKEICTIIIKIANDHHRCTDFLTRVNQLIFIFKEDIQKNFSNNEIFDIFESNMNILLFLLEEKIFYINKEIVNKINDNGFRNYLFFFYPEVKNYISDKDRKKIENKIKIQCGDMNVFLRNRKIGENHNHLCKLIRNDLIDEFIPCYEKWMKSLPKTEYPLEYSNKIFNSNPDISFLESLKTQKPNYPKSRRFGPNFQASIGDKDIDFIERSKFETNSLLMRSDCSFIQYSAFFGSTKIFEYFLKKKDHHEKSFLWILAIHSNNFEIIDMLMKYKIKFDPYKCYKETIKCHHSELSSFFLTILMKISNDVIDKKKILSKKIKYHNYIIPFDNMPDDLLKNIYFYQSCKYNQIIPVKILLKSDKFDINKLSISISTSCNSQRLF